MKTKFINCVREMRNYQKEYFRLAGMAKKNRIYWPEAKNALANSKRFEIDVDRMLVQMEKEVEA